MLQVIDSGAAGGVRTLDFQNHNRYTGTLKGTEASLPVENSKIGSPADTDGNGLISYNKLHQWNPISDRSMAMLIDADRWKSFLVDTDKSGVIRPNKGTVDAERASK